MPNKKADVPKEKKHTSSEVLHPVARSIISSLDTQDWQIITFEMPETQER